MKRFQHLNFDLNRDLPGQAKVLLPLVLWGMLWLSIKAGSTHDILQFENITSFVHGVRGLFPFIAGGLGGAYLFWLAYYRRFDWPLVAGPLGFAAIYGLVGIVATVLSPDKSQALYWGGSYISVPIVLWAITSGSGSLARVQRIVDITWGVMALVAVVALGYSFLKLDLIDAILEPEILARCDFAYAWFLDNHGLLRSTGVGRYAAVGGLVAIAGVCRGQFRAVWWMVLFAALLLLLSSGARTAFVGFTGASVMMVVLYGNKRTVGALAIASIAVIGGLWISGVHKPFTDDCLLRRYQQINTTPVVAADPEPVVRSVAPPTSLGPDHRLWIGDAELINTAPLVSFSGRSTVWFHGIALFEKSPLLGYGFHADRIILNSHIHNGFIHSLVQAGIFGGILFVAAFFFSWMLFFRAIFRLQEFTQAHQSRLILAGGIMAFFTIRGISESTAAFFGIDWLLVAPVMLYISVASSSKDALEPAFQGPEPAPDPAG